MEVCQFHFFFSLIFLHNLENKIYLFLQIPFSPFKVSRGLPLKFFTFTKAWQKLKSSFSLKNDHFKIDII